MNYNHAAFIASYGLSSQLPQSDRAEIIFSGRSNVGKSSLINKVCNRKNLARVSSTPGKTATINFYAVDTSYLVDLPGYGYAKVSNAERKRWDNLINRYFEADRAHTLLIQLLDCRHAPSKDDMQMLEYLRFHGIPFMVALTKGDKLKKSQLAATQAEFETICAPYGCKTVLLTSAEKGAGMEELREILNVAVAQVEEAALLEEEQAAQEAAQLSLETEPLPEQAELLSEEEV
ncbi:MAG: ribosome biogenesis GTP-binding protein YihA/YsxC [Faecalibacterium sp.]